MSQITTDSSRKKTRTPENSNKTFAKLTAVSLIAALGLGVSSCTRPRNTDTSGSNQPDIEQVEKSGFLLGKNDGGDFYLQRIGDRFLLSADGFQSIAVVEHVPDPNIWKPGDEHSFESEKLESSIPGHSTYIITVDGQRYAFVDGYKSGDLTKISMPKVEAEFRGDLQR